MAADTPVNHGESAPQGEHCQDCGAHYTTVYWLPTYVWVVVTPKPENLAAGLLCPACADRRADDAGMTLNWTAEVLT